ncbi:MAG: ABC transporter ATP-binding protein [Candidatus Heimdallarchaeota archaeon]|nr:ABC transporter ATP-binding protein [Candidatus Heimdallarchaeota archaeon]
MIELKAIGKHYQMGEIKVKALDDINLEITKGEIVVLLGPSGSGKTTLLNLIGALDSPTAGEIDINGTRISKYKRSQQFKFRRNTIAFIFQTFNLFPTLSAFENVQYVAELSKIKESKKKSKDALEAVGLGGRIRHFPHQLSGGEQQRVAIARALVKESPIILADEPTGELDFKTGKQILELLVQQHGNGTTVLIVTHNREIARVSNRVVELHSGKVTSDGPPQNGKVPIDKLHW